MQNNKIRNYNRQVYLRESSNGLSVSSMYLGKNIHETLNNTLSRVLYSILSGVFSLAWETGNNIVLRGKRGNY